MDIENMNKADLLALMVKINLQFILLCEPGEKAQSLMLDSMTSIRQTVDEVAK